MDDVDNASDYRELVRRTQRGDQESLDRLIRLARGKLRTYIYRLTLDHDLTHDLLQETLLHLVESLKQLERVDAFWPWLYRTALGKVQHHFRRREREAEATRHLQANGESAAPPAPSDGADGLSTMIREELLEATVEAIERLNLRQRAVLVLRCFEQKSYAEIAAIMDCSEMAAQVLMFRAKRSLRRHLSRRGFKGGLLCIGLGLFARRTASAGASSVAVSVSRASLAVGAPARSIAILSTHLGAAIGVVLIVVVMAVAGWRVTRRDDASGSPGAGAPDAASRATVFEYPSHLPAAHDPDGDGWRGIEADQVVSRPVDPNVWLCGGPFSEQSSVILPAGHWVELAFGGEIVDAPGDDVFVVEWGANGERARVLVTDGQGRTCALGEIRAARAGLQVPTESGFDLAEANVPFVPRAIRIVSTGGGGGTDGFDLHGVRARVRRASDRQ